MHQARFFLTLALLFAATTARAETLGVVLPFIGPSARTAEAAAIEVMGKHLILVASEKWQNTARERGATSPSAEDVASVANQLGVKLIVVGIVRREGPKWRLTAGLRDGVTGRSRDKFSYPLKSMHIDEETVSLFQKDLAAALERALPPILPHPVAIAPPAVAPRPKWAEFFDVSLGLMLSGRRLDFVPRTLPRFTSGVVAGLHFDFTGYPFALLWQKARGVAAGMGFGLTIDKPFWPTSTVTGAMASGSYSTSELRVDGGLRWRFQLTRKPPWPELTLRIGGGLHQFAIGKTAQNLDVGPPDVSNSYIGFGLGAGVRPVDFLKLWALFQYNLAITSGAIESLNEFGTSNHYGLRIDGGADFFVWRGLKIGVAGFYEHYGYSFLPNSIPVKMADSSTEKYFGGTVSIGYVL